MAKKKSCEDKVFVKDEVITDSLKTKDKPLQAKVMFGVYNWYPKGSLIYVSEQQLKQTTQLLFIK